MYTVRKGTLYLVVAGSLADMTRYLQDWSLDRACCTLILATAPSDRVTHCILSHVNLLHRSGCVLLISLIVLSLLALGGIDARYSDTNVLISSFNIVNAVAAVARIAH